MRPARIAACFIVLMAPALLAQRGAGARDQAIGMIPLDNGLQIFIRESQVPPDMKEYLHLKTQKELQKIKQMMKEENFKPSTRPAPTGNENL